MEKKERIFYRLKLNGNYLGFESHGDCTQILVIDNEHPAKFSTKFDAVDAIVDDFLFHHGLHGTDITESTSTTDRLKKIQIEKVKVVEESEDLDSVLDFLPTNKEIAEFRASHGDNGYLPFIYQPGTKRREKGSYGYPYNGLDPDGHDLATRENLVRMGKITWED